MINNDVAMVYASLCRQKSTKALEILNKYRVFDDITAEDRVRITAALEDCFWQGVCSVLDLQEERN